MKPQLSWLENELPLWIKEDIISKENAEILLSKYKVETSSHSKASFAIPVILGSLLIGAGIISLFAYNWEYLGKYAKAFLSIVLLLSAQYGVFWIKKNKPDSLGANEGISLFWFLAFSASFAIISQTYNLGGNLDDFFRALTLFSLPIIYICNSRSVAIAVFAAITSIICSHEWIDTTMSVKIFDYALLLLWMPFYVWHLKSNYLSISSALLNVVFAIGMFSIICSIASSYQQYVITLFLSILWLIGVLLYNENEKFYKRSFELLSKIGIFVTLIVFCIGDFWFIPDRAYQYETLYYILLIVFLICFVCFCALRRNRLFELLIPLSPFILQISYSLFVNIVVAIGAVAMIAGGVIKSELALANQGTALILCVIMIRFFSSDLSLLTKGIAFVLFGIGFLLLNIIVRKSLKRDAK